VNPAKGTQIGDRRPKPKEKVMELLTEAGIFGYVAFIAWIIGIVMILRRPAKAMVHSIAAAVFVLGLCAMGFGVGQRLVDRAVELQPDVNQKVAMLSQGSKEASGNLLLGGIFAISLVGLGAGVGSMRGRDKEAS
jgi:hypothetical protein